MAKIFGKSKTSGKATTAMTAKHAKLAAKARKVADEDEDEDADEDAAPPSRKASKTPAKPAPKATRKGRAEPEEDEDEEAAAEETEPVTAYLRGYSMSLLDTVKDIRGWTKAHRAEHGSFAKADAALVEAMEALAEVAAEE